MPKISPHHPRAESLRIREKIVAGFRSGMVVPEGLAAHGRGEAFDYLLGERTSEEARRAIKAAAALMLLSYQPVISVNGNSAALVPDEMVRLSKLTGARIEVNLFHRTKKRLEKIKKWLKAHGATEVLGTEKKFCTRIPEIHSERRVVDQRGIATADVVFIPLEDGDRAEALKKLGKKIIAVDLNPMSRTARAADITIVDNIVRAMPLLVEEAERFSSKQKEELQHIVEGFDNRENLNAMLKLMSESARI
ncbi:MAG: 4-phosphopantoate--beta-alanine ligase [Candidatus Hadarchaeales archaeon]